MLRKLIFGGVFVFLICGQSGLAKDIKQAAEWTYDFNEWENASFDTNGLLLTNGLYRSSDILFGIEFEYRDKRYDKKGVAKFQGIISDIPANIKKTNSDNGFTILGITRYYVFILFSEKDDAGNVTNYRISSYKLRSSGAKSYGNISLGIYNPTVMIYKNDIMVRASDITIYNLKFTRVRMKVSSENDLLDLERPLPTSWYKTESGDKTTTISVYK